MFKFVVNIFRDKSSDINSKVKELSLGDVLDDIVNNSPVSNPIAKYYDYCSWYDDGKPYRLANGIGSTHLLCTAKKIKKECKLSSLNITDDWSNIGKCKVEFDVDEYEKVYMHNKFSDIRTEVICIKDKYENMSESEIIILEDSYRATFNTINEILKESNYYIDQDEYTLIMDIINKFNKDIEIGKEESKKCRLEKLKMEVDYLNKIKETRQMFEKMSNA